MDPLNGPNGTKKMRGPRYSLDQCITKTFWSPPLHCTTFLMLLSGWLGTLSKLLFPTTPALSYALHIKERKVRVPRFYVVDTPQHIGLPFGAFAEQHLLCNGTFQMLRFLIMHWHKTSRELCPLNFCVPFCGSISSRGLLDGKGFLNSTQH